MVRNAIESDFLEFLASKVATIGHLVKVAY